MAWPLDTLSLDSLDADTDMPNREEFLKLFRIVKAIIAAGESSLLAVPPGTIVGYGGATAPEGWLLCQGQAVSRTTYARLFAAIGEGYGASDGLNTFLLPDLRGRGVMGAGGPSDSQIGNALGNAGGSRTAMAELRAHTHAAGTLKADAGGAHTHTYEYKPGQTNRGGDGRAPYFWSGAALGTTSEAPAHTHALSGRTSVAGTGSRTGHPNVPPSLIANFIIRT